MQPSGKASLTPVRAPRKLASFGSTTAVDVGAMIDAHDEDDVGIGIDADQYAIVTTPRTAISGQIIVKWLARSLWIVGKRPGDEFDDRCGDLGRQMMEPTPRTARNLDAPTVDHAGGSPNSSRRSSPPTVSPAAYSRSACSTASRTPGCDSQ